MHTFEIDYRELLENSLAGVYLIINNNFVYCNQNGATLFGYQPEEIIGHITPIDLVYPADRPLVVENMRKKLMGEIDSTRYCFRGKHKNGSIVYCEAYGRRILFEGKSAILGTLFDITEGKQIEIALQESNNFNDTLLKTIPLPMDIVDEDCNILFLNHLLEKVVGKEAIGQKCYKVFRDNQIQCGNCPLRYKIPQGETITIESKGAFGGKTFEISHTLMIYQGKNAILEVFHDITERKLMEERLKQYVEIVNNMPMGIGVWQLEDPNDCLSQRLIIANPVSFDFTGVPHEQTIGKTIKEAFPAMANSPLPQLGAEVIRTRLPKDLGEHHYADDRIHNMYFSLKAFPLPNNCVGLVWENITQRKLAEQQILKLNEELENHVIELETMNKELETFSYTVSHDLRNPLTVINGLSHTLLINFSEKMDDRIKESLQRILVNGQRMTDIIKDIMELSHASRCELKYDNVDLSSMIKNFMNELIRSQPERQVECHMAEDIYIRGDKGLIRIVVENLLRNSWKYTGKKINAVIEFGMFQNNGNRVYFIRDNGVGFDMQQADKLFEPFQRLHTKSEFEGSGVGLATVHRIIQRHGGKIWAESAINNGATFYFTI